MRTPEEIAENLRIRINNEINYFNGHVPERNAIAWRAYLSALAEWEVISLGMCLELSRLLPEVEDDPAVAIALGREEPEEEQDD